MGPCACRKRASPTGKSSQVRPGEAASPQGRSCSLSIMAWNYNRGWLGYAIPSLLGLWPERKAARDFRRVIGATPKAQTWERSPPENSGSARTDRQGIITHQGHAGIPVACFGVWATSSARIPTGQARPSQGGGAGAGCACPSWRSQRISCSRSLHWSQGALTSRTPPWWC